MKPFRWLWDQVKKIVKKVWKKIVEFFTGKMKGNSVWAKIGQCFGRVINGIKESRAWKTIANSAVGRFFKRWGPKILAKVTDWGGKMLNIAGWVLLVNDIKDAATTSMCTVIAFENEGDPSKMPDMCDEEVTKAYVQWALEKAGMGTEHGDWDEKKLEEVEEGQEQEGAYTTSTVSMWTWEETPTTATPQVVYEIPNPLVATETATIG